MKRVLLSAACIIFLSVPNARAEYAPGEILIRFKPGITRSITAASSDAKRAEIGASGISSLTSRCKTDTPAIKGILGSTGILHLKFPAGTDIQKIIEKYKGDAEVEYAEPNYLRHAFVTTPNDPKYSQQWGLTKIMADYAWDVNQGTDSVIVAVIDTGVDTDHPDLLTNLMLPGRHFLDNGSDINSGANDGYGHGTHVAGIIAAVTNNSTGVAGVAWHVKILPVKVLNDDSGSGWDSDVALGMEWAISQGAKVLNLSLGSPDYSAALQTSVNNARSGGRVVVAAAGNDGISEVNYPAGCNGAIAVGATDENDKRASFSNFGSWITVCAPGVWIWSTYPNHPHTSSPATFNYTQLNGTSMATPFVSGVAALIFSRYQSPLISGADVELRLARGVDDLGAVGKDSIFGNGRINAAKAIGDFLSEVEPDKIITYPNPLRFPGVTDIKVKNIPLSNKLTVRVYNIAGELVRAFRDDEIILNFNPDYVYIKWDGTNDAGEDLAAGVYLLSASDGTTVATKKIMLLR